MRDERSEWTRTYDTLIRSMEKLGFKAELGDQIARQLGSPKAMERMIAYLEYVKPRSAEVAVAEMLAICSDIDAWKQKKACEEYTARYNELLYYGLDTGEE